MTLQWDELTDAQKPCIRELSNQSLLFYSRAMFRFQQADQFMVNWHHHLICDELERVARGETDNLIINMPPGGSKTHLGSICFPSWCFSQEINCRFLTVSYSADLVKNVISGPIRDVIKSEEYQDMWPVQMSTDTDAKDHWKLLNNRGKKAGEFKCASNGGSITGFRAGKLARDKFYGALILDDPNKPLDMLTNRKRENSNEILATVKSRLGSPKTPIIIIQQRLHALDATGFRCGQMTKVSDSPWLCEWKSGGKITRQIIIPALIDDTYVKSLPEKYQRYVTGMLYDMDQYGRYSYWPEKETLQGMLEIEEQYPFMFEAQYQQNPPVIGGKVLSGESFLYCNNVTQPAEYDWTFITGDTAQKAKDTSDYTVFCAWGVKAGNLYLLDIERGKWEAPQMQVKLRMLVARTRDSYGSGKLRGVWVEDAASGTSLIQLMRNSLPVPINPYKPNRLGKWASCQDTLPFLQSEYSNGRVWLNEDFDAKNHNRKLKEWVDEMCAFTSDDSHDHDDQCDNLFMAVRIGLTAEILGGSGDAPITVGGSTGAYSF